ncbi:hypothetical protein C5B96_08580 [Subtercola sp. Z020]|nr:hypothetical protein C5B96_08580 [Subtercola sp. Z020]
MIESHPLPAVEDAETEAPASEVQRTKRPSGAHITEGNARLIAFTGMFPCVDAEGLSMLSNRQETRFAPGGELTSIKGTKQRLNKIVRIGALKKTTNMATRVEHYGITDNGIGSAWSFGYTLERPDKLDNLSKSRLTHYQMIAHVAAQFASPQGFFRKSLGVGPVPLDNLVSEKMMRGSFDPVMRKIKAKPTADHRGDFGRWRADVIKSASEAVNAGRLQWSEIVEQRPALLTVGAAQRGDTKLKAVHQHDLTVILDGDRTGPRAKNLLVEIEISKKSWEEYDAIFATLAAELKEGSIYDRAIYFTHGVQISSLLRRVNARGSHGLIESGQLRIFPLLHRDGTPFIFNNRVPVGGN